MKILLTGGCGFIGSHIADHLINSDIVEKVFIVDNLSTGNLINIDAIKKNKKIELVIGDIRDFALCESLTSKCSVVCHQAALGSVPRSIDNPLDTHLNNVDGTLNLLISSKKNKIKKFIFASSSSVYGDNFMLPKIENKLGNPLSPYALSKSITEQYSLLFSRLYDFNFIGLRYFNVFGPRQNPVSQYSAVIPKFCFDILKNKKITINGDGSISRDFTYIHNIVLANHLSIFNDNLDNHNSIYNVGCGKTYSLKELAINLRDISNIDFEIDYAPKRNGDVDSSLADISKISTSLDFIPTVNFYDGLKLTWDYYKNLYKGI